MGCKPSESSLNPKGTPVPQPAGTRLGRRGRGVQVFDLELKGRAHALNGTPAGVCSPASEALGGLGLGGGDIEGRGSAASEAPVEGSYVICLYSSVLAACTRP